MPGPPAPDNSCPAGASCAGQRFLSLRLLLLLEMLSLPENSFLEVVTGEQLGQQGMFPVRYGGGGLLGAWLGGWQGHPSHVSGLSVTAMSPTGCQSVWTAIHPLSPPTRVPTPAFDAFDSQVSEELWQGWGWGGRVGSPHLGILLQSP